jgi:hypothetical protein
VTTTDAPAPLLLAYAVAALATLWLVTANLAALSRHRASLGGKPASRASRVAWVLSVVAVWCGPLVVVAALVAALLGAREKRRVERGQATRRSRLPAEMAVKNGVVILAATVVVVVLVFAGWRA